MTGVLNAYLSRLFLKLTLGAALSLAALVQLLDLVDGATDILDRGQGADGLAYYTALRFPMIVDQILPLSVLVGALVTFALLARNNEIVVMRGAGATTGRLVLVVLPTVILLATLHLVLGDQIVPRAQRSLAGWWAASEPVPAGNDMEATWLRVGASLVSVRRVLEDGNRLEGVRIYERDPAGVVRSRVVAPLAVYAGGTWRLHDAVETRFETGAPAAAPPRDRPWDVALRPANVVDTLTPMGRVPAATAQAVLAGETVGNGSPAFYRTLLQRTFAEPATSLVMLLLAAPVALSSRRGGEAGRRFLAALAFGLLYLLLDGITTALGQAGALPVLVAAWGPTLLFAGLGALALFHLERS